MASILRVTAREGATKTRVMYGAYLSYAQMKEYLDFLVGKGLLTQDESGIFRLTDSGMHLLSTFEGIDSMIKLEKPKVTPPTF